MKKLWPANFKQDEVEAPRGPGFEARLEQCRVIRGSRLLAGLAGVATGVAGLVAAQPPHTLWHSAFPFCNTPESEKKRETVTVTA